MNRDKKKSTFEICCDEFFFVCNFFPFFCFSSSLSHFFSNTYNGNQFNNRVIQSFIFCHNLIKKSKYSQFNGKRTMRSLYICAIIDCSLHWFLVINQCIFFDALDSITFYVIFVICLRLGYVQAANQTKQIRLLFAPKHQKFNCNK